MKNYQISVFAALPFIVFLLAPANGVPAHSLQRRQSSSQLEALKSKMTPIGELTKTMHKVEGMVWTLNDSVIVIENFVYDGKGFGVHVNVATEGTKLREYAANRQIVGYPDPEDVSKPIEEEYKKEDKRWLVIRLPSTIKTSDVKWLSLWCDIFNLSFGHVEFP